ncbi:MAG: tripartite tricarboxylate transporter substrate binding protein [Alphaproteobacteria bacterium]|nr:tripartite tricarboxylate transporter substrate binding protein [Alphaproteobacteria bacterium]
MARWKYACVALAAWLSATVCGAQNFPSQAIRLVVPFPVGGPADSIARWMGNAIANAQLPFSDFRGLVEYARANPLKLSYATAGIGSVGHMIGESLGSEVGAKMIHVPYKGTGPAAQDLLAGVVPLFIETSSTTALQHASTGKVRILAVTRKSRSAQLSQVPALGELGFGDLDSPAWFGLVGPAGMPPEVVTKINHVVTQALRTPQAKEAFARIGADPAPTAPEEFAQYIDLEIVRWGRVIKKADIKPM